MGPYAGVDYNFTSCRLQIDLNTSTMGNPMPESTLTPCKSRLIPQSGTQDLDLMYCTCLHRVHAFFLMRINWKPTLFPDTVHFPQTAPSRYIFYQFLLSNFQRLYSISFNTSFSVFSLTSPSKIISFQQNLNLEPLIRQREVFTFFDCNYYPIDL